MRKTILFAALCCLVVTISNAQTYFQKTFSVTSNTPDICPLIGQSGLLLATGSESSSTNSMITLFSLDPAGQVIGTSKLTFPSSGQEATAVAKSGNQYFVGYKDHASEKGGFVILDAQLNVVIAKEMSSLSSFSLVKDIAPTADGGALLLMGTYEIQYWVRVDATGSTQWVKRVTTDQAYWTQVRTLPSGDFIFFGTTYPEGMNAIPSVAIAKATSTGTVSWMKSYQATDGQFFPYGDVLTDGHFGMVSLSELPPFGERVIRAINVDANGTLVWAKSISNNSNLRPYALAALPNGGFAYSGTTQDSAGYGLIVGTFDATGTIGTVVNNGSTQDPACSAVLPATNGDLFLLIGHADFNGSPVMLMRTDGQGVSCSPLSITTTTTTPTFTTNVITPSPTTGISFNTLSVSKVTATINSDYQCQVVGKPEPIGLQTLKIFPNPIRDHGYVEIPNLKEGLVEMKITSMDGRNMTLRLTRNGNLFRFNTQGLTTGHYMFQVTQNGFMLGSGRFLIGE